MTDDEIRKALLDAFEYSYQHEDWVTPLDELLSGLTFAEALLRPQPEAKCIWEIVLHLALWHENIVLRILTGTNVESAEGHWPELPTAADDAAWEAANQRLVDSLESVRKMLETVPISKILESPYGMADLICRFTHNGYHSGQIWIMRLVADPT